MIEQRPGQKIFTVPGPDWGVRVIEPAAMAADWWDPDGSIEADNPGIQMWPLRAINSVGTPWGGGPTNYLETRSSQYTPLPTPGGLLIEGNGAVPWAAATGWGFVAAAAQYFLTGLIPANDQSWSVLVQFDNLVGIWGVLLGCFNAAWTYFVIQPMSPASVIYGNGNVSVVAPGHITGNLGIAGNQGYRDGIADGGPIGLWNAPSVLDIYIGCRNNAGVAWGFSTADIGAMAIYNATLTAPQMLAVATAMAAL